MKCNSSVRQNTLAGQAWPAVVCSMALLPSLWKIPRCLRTERALEILCKLSVIIPARNEEHGINDLLNSLFNQPWGPKEIIVVDDFSTDRTARIAKESAVKVITPPDLPPGWTGKTWALYQGAKEATGDFLLFLDADLVLEPWALLKICGEYYSHRGVLSIMPFSDVVRPYQMCYAFFNIAMMAGLSAGSWSGAHRGLFGPSLLCSRKDYFRIGGHEQVRHSLVENLKLAHYFAQAHIPIRLFGGEGTLSRKMYPGGMQEMSAGLVRSTLSGASAGSLYGIVVMTLWISGFFLILRMILRRDYAKSKAAVPILYLMYAAEVYWALKKLGSYKLLTALLFPVPLFYYLGIFGISFLRDIHGKKSWKGRAY